MSLEERDDMLLDLNVFDSEQNDFASRFMGHDFSFDDFVKRWQGIHKEGENLEANNITQDETEPGTSFATQNAEEDVIKAKRKRRPLVSGRKRALLAWDRNVRNKSDQTGVSFGAEGWPPPFRSLVQEMRQRIIFETGKEADWDSDDVAMLRKYYYLKHNIPVSLFPLYSLYSRAVKSRGSLTT